jgi:hypothetical protein
MADSSHAPYTSFRKDPQRQGPDMNWKPGDRVRVLLPDRNLRQGGGGHRSIWVSGTVREVDPPELRPGVRVGLDRQVNGVSECFATHAELRLEVQPG